MMAAQAMDAKRRAQARVAAQRTRILQAAEKCFVERGFHAASMATIAQTAAMSPGLIYRYFHSKSEIILAIIERQLETARERIGALHGANDLAASLADSFQAAEQDDCEQISAPLFLEMSAEATRDPQIGAAMHAFDATVRGDLAGVLTRSRERGGYGLPAPLAEARALMLLCLIEGLKVREAREPGLDRGLLETALADILAMLLAPLAPGGADLRP
ncbi:MAG: TetR/AcrR family transcriptional regulator [Steroidobacteraceae bacterium]|nr:TetR/AcrR family transcriptional regulator [Steroidobacteraceae bacterium]MCW5573727.1 TetR/AcrR family transcriptional regulator [Steroidobacteraceae bacterium]